jgi:drug/metabolite transporter (DMT)-like permease
MLLAIGLGAAAVLLLMARSFEAYAQAPLGFGLGLLAGLGWAVGTLILKHKHVDVPATVLTVCRTVSVPPLLSVTVSWTVWSPAVA